MGGGRHSAPANLSSSSSTSRGLSTFEADDGEETCLVELLSSRRLDTARLDASRAPVEIAVVGAPPTDGGWAEADAGRRGGRHTHPTPLPAMRVGGMLFDPRRSAWVPVAGTDSAAAHDEEMAAFDDVVGPPPHTSLSGLRSTPPTGASPMPRGPRPPPPPPQQPPPSSASRAPARPAAALVRTITLDDALRGWGAGGVIGGEGTAEAAAVAAPVPGWRRHSGVGARGGGDGSNDAVDGGEGEGLAALLAALSAAAAAHARSLAAWRQAPHATGMAALPIAFPLPLSRFPAGRPVAESLAAGGGGGGGGGAEGGAGVPLQHWASDQGPAGSRSPDGHSGGGAGGGDARGSPSPSPSPRHPLPMRPQPRAHLSPPADLVHEGGR